ncbi:MAG: hypothetical protein D6719_11765 [Candidatus Dadabacteria bacterium]|nr:MAG: hypothetical protein D6719_11765 [Candidatus Dadabacteria bacterium]
MAVIPERVTNLLKSLYLIVIFVVSFCLPLYMLKLFVFNSVTGSSNEISDSKENFFDGAVNFTRNQHHLVINASSYINPDEKNDFLIAGWFNLKTLPREGEQITLLSKVDKGKLVKPGYALKLIGERQGVRALVYWRDNFGSGGWKPFETVDLVPHHWFMLALSFYQGRYLGLHYRSISDKSFKLLGGHEFESEVFPAADSNLLIASSGFRGKIGPFGVFRPHNLEQRLSKLLDEIFSSSLGEERITAVFNSQEVSFWTTDWKIDQGSFGHVIEIRSGR